MIENFEYPKIKVLRKNAYYAGILQNLLFGSEGIFIFLMQINYQMAILNDFNKNYVDVLNFINNLQIKFYKALSQAIIMCGGDPIFANSQGKWITGRQVDYIKDFKQIVNYNIEIKEKSLIDLKFAFSKIDNIEIKNLLKLLIKDEEVVLGKLKSFNHFSN